MPVTQISIEEYFIGSGKITENQIVTELCMFKALEVLSKCSSAVASAIFFTLDSLPAKKTLLQRVADAAGDEEDKQLVGQINEAADKANNQRRDTAHAAVAFSGENIKSQMSMANFKRKTMQVASKDSMNTMVRHSGEAVHEASAAIQKLCQKHGADLQFNRM
jgi:hypothetical protein